MDHQPPDVERLSAALWDIPSNLQGRDYATSPAHPPTMLGPPVAQPNDAIQPVHGVSPAPILSTSATAPGVASGDVFMTSPVARVYILGPVHVGTAGISGLDPDVYALQMT